MLDPTYDHTNADRLRELHEDLRTPHPSLVEQKPKGGTMLSYVGHAAVTEMLLRHDPMWFWEPCGRGEGGEPILDRNSDGRPTGMWIRLYIFGHSRIGYGSVEPADRRSDGDLIKEIIGDGIRNAAMRFGVALNLWSKNDLESAAPEPSPADNVMAQATGWSKTKRGAVKAALIEHGIIEDKPMKFEEFAAAVAKHPEIAKDIDAWFKSTKDETGASASEQKIIKDLEEIAEEE